MNCASSARNQSRGCVVDSLAQLEAELPRRLCHGARVLKQHRGHSGIGVRERCWSRPSGLSVGGSAAHAELSLVVPLR